MYTYTFVYVCVYCYIFDMQIKNTGDEMVKCPHFFTLAFIYHGFSFIDFNLSDTYLAYK